MSSPSACTSGMQSHWYTLQKYPNKSSQTVILSAAKGLCTFAMKLLQVTGARQQSSARTAS